MDEKKKLDSSISPEEARQYLVFLTQSDNPYHRLVATIGAKYFVRDKNAVHFRFALCRKANRCTVEYDPGLDLFNLKFKKVYKFSIQRALKGLPDVEDVKSFDGLFADQLKEVFENFTKLYLSL